MPTIPLTTPIRDRPLSAIDDNRQQMHTRPQKMAPDLPPQTAQRPAQAADDKKRRKVKPSSLCKTPPSVIQGTTGYYQRGDCIGEGGFARCFRVNDTNNGELYAAKTLAKLALTTEKTRAKLITEIKLHRALDHPNIVKFIDCFEDRRNVYILLEMCANQSLADMVAKRRHLTEPEARFFMVEIMGAMQYMHSRGVVHRDLKLGNIFIDQHMHLKVGDFGLAARIVNKARRYTVCGTPNYISPEVLVRPHGHSYETDIWSLGIILYALLVGRPPFQDREIDVIYQRIRHHEVSFPPAPSPSLQAAWDQVSAPARDLVTKLLHPDPQKRPSIMECLNHPFIQQGVFVNSIPSSALTEVVLLRAGVAESAQNLSNLVKHVGLGGDSEVSKPLTAAVQVNDVEAAQTSADQVLPTSISPPSTREKYQAVPVPSDSPAASQAETNMVPVYDSPIVGRKVPRGQNAYHASPVVARLRSEDDVNEVEMSSANNAAGGEVWRQNRYVNRLRFPLASRTSTSAVAPAISDSASNAHVAGTAVSGAYSSTNNAPTTSQANAHTNHPHLVIASTDKNAVSREQNGAPVTFGALNTNMMATRPSQSGPARMMARPATSTSLNIVQVLRVSLRKTLQSVRGAIRSDASSGLPSLVDGVEPPVILTRWADFEESWGISYTLSDGCTGMLFRDRTSMRMDPVFDTYVYFEDRTRPGMLTAHRTPADTEDPRRRKKIGVLAYVRRYMDRELAHAVPISRPGGDVSNGEILYHITKCNECVMFVMTDGTLQFNFRDHFKAVVYDNGNKLGLVTDQHQLFCWNLKDAITATQATHFQRVGLLEKLMTIHNETHRYYKSIE